MKCQRHYRMVSIVLGVLVVIGKCWSLVTPHSKSMHAKAGFWWKQKEQILLEKNRAENVELMREEISFSSKESEKQIHEYFMNLALEEAQIAADQYNEVPIGAVLVLPISNNDDKNNNLNKTFEIIAKGHNLVETLQDASAHAEMMVFRKAASQMGNWRLYNMTLYCTCEPCVMCCAAAQAFRIDTVVYGAPDKRLGAIKTHIPLLEIATHPYHTTLTAIGGVLEDQCSQILIQFFRNRRKQNKKNKQTNTSKKSSLSSSSTATITSSSKNEKLNVCDKNKQTPSRLRTIPVSFWKSFRNKLTNVLKR